MSNNKQTPVWLSGVIAFLLLVIAVLLVWLLINKIGTLKFCPTLPPENWFSYIVTLIGVLITLFVGFQIFNMVEIRREIKDAEGKYEELKNDTELFTTNSRDFLSKLEKEMGAFKLELLNKYNDTERGLMKELNENTQKVDWYLKDIKKEHWDRLNDLNESTEKSKKTQEDIKKEMDDILDKWGTINEKQDESRRAISSVLIGLCDQYKEDNEMKIFLLLYAIDIHPDYKDNDSRVVDLLDIMLDLLDKIDKLRDDDIYKNAKCLRDIHFEKLKDKENIQKKIDKILYLIDGKTPSTENKEEQKES